MPYWAFRGLEGSELGGPPFDRRVMKPDDRLALRSIPPVFAGLGSLVDAGERIVIIAAASAV
jgi:hypothetical protein